MNAIKWTLVEIEPDLLPKLILNSSFTKLVLKEIEVGKYSFGAHDGANRWAIRISGSQIHGQLLQL